MEQHVDITDTPSVELHYANRCPLPVLQGVAESLVLPGQPSVIIQPTSQATIAQQNQFVSDSPMELKNDFDINEPVLQENTKIHYAKSSSSDMRVPKYLSSSDILCDNCNAITPSNTKMLYCDRCHIHLCGNCILSFTHDHSTYCPNILRYMRKDEEHLQLVPSSDHSYKKDNSKDAVVPSFDSYFNSLASACMNSFDKKVKKKMKELQSERTQTHDPGGHV